MSDKNLNQSQIEKLIEMANQLEKREQALSRESSHLEKLRAALDERERRLSSQADAEPLSRSRAAAEPASVKSEPVYRERPLNAPLAAPPPPARPQSTAPAKPKAPAPKAQAMSSDTVSELSDILKNIFWDYSNSVHQISSQLSTVTAAMMCAAVTCVLENRGFDAKDVFMQEMEKLLHGGNLGEVCLKPSKFTRPAPVSMPAQKPAPAQMYTPAPAQLFTPAPVTRSEVLDADEDDEEVYQAEGDAVEAPQRTEDGVLRIGSAAESQKLGEYGFRNDDKIVRVELPEGVLQLPGSFFYGCGNLEEVWLPDSLRDIGPYAFYGCEKLRVVHLGDASALRDIGEYAFAMCGALESFEVPPMVEALGTSVFRFCSGLTRIGFTKDSLLHTIGSHLLQNCTSLDKVRLPDSITVIPTSMFYGCSQLKKVVAKGVDTIEDYAFYGNTSLRTVRIRAKKVIAPQAFEGCDPALEIEYLNY
ncbi:MAG: leucine-rich repeat domain-containing protein [Bacillota bacterium]